MKDIESFISQISDRLPPFKQVGNDVEYYFGKELKLTGVSHFKGVPLDDNEIYSVDMPILQSIDHKTALRNAWLRNGLQGIYNYIQPYIGMEQLNLVKQHFMKAA